VSVEQTYNHSTATRARLAQLTKWATMRPRKRTLVIAAAASRRYGLDAPKLSTELGAHTHAVAMTGLVDRLCAAYGEQRESIKEQAA
jgi:short subunit dehydrogenase-like uncharacterized protein